MRSDECNPGDLVESRGKQWVIGDKSLWNGVDVWGIPATKTGNADKRYCGVRLDPASLTLVRRKHRWSGAGYVCADCGAIKDTPMENNDCSGDSKTGFDVWLYHAGAGWWLAETQSGSLKEAMEEIRNSVGHGNTVAGAILPAGQPLGLFTKEQRIP